METKYLKINPADNVVVAISDLKAGEAITVDGHAITLKEDVPAGHKVTLKDFAQGENIIKYGYPIGHAVTAVEQGRWINETQIKTNLAGLLDYTYNPVSVDLNIPKKDLTFKGYRRKNGVFLFCSFKRGNVSFPHPAARALPAAFPKGVCIST